MNEDAAGPLKREIEALRRQTRILQGVVIALASCWLLTGAPPTASVLRARGLVIVDSSGRDRIVLGDTAPGAARTPTRPTTTLAFKSESGQDRVVLGQEPDPRKDGRTSPRAAPGWGMVIYAPNGDERGGFGYLDGRGASIAIDRPTGDALGMLVDEKTDLAAFVLNYRGDAASPYPTALEVGTKHDSAFVESRNRDGRSAGSLTVSGSGRATLSSEVGLDGE